MGSRGSGLHPPHRFQFFSNEVGVHDTAPRLSWECQIGRWRVTDSNPVTRLKLLSPCADMG
jgi:hypothetical protein